MRVTQFVAIADPFRIVPARHRRAVLPVTLEALDRTLDWTREGLCNVETQDWEHDVDGAVAGAIELSRAQTGVVPMVSVLISMPGGRAQLRLAV